MMGNKSDENESGCFPTSGLYGTWRLSVLLFSRSVMSDSL